MRVWLIVLAVLVGSSIASRTMSIRLYNGTVASLWKQEDDIGSRFNCDHTSYSVVTCIKEYVDLDHDDGVTPKEIDSAKSTYMHWYEKVFDFVANAGSSKDICDRCDLNDNGKIDVDDLIEWSHRCQEYKTDDEANADQGHLCLCNCEAIDSISKYLCDRARDG